MANNLLKVAVLDVDICGPSIPKLLRVENSEIVSTQWGWTPIKYVLEHMNNSNHL